MNEMALICISHPYSQGAKKAEEVIRAHEQPVARRYGLKTRWSAQTLFVERAGMKAQIEIDEHRLEVKIEVPWAFRKLAPQIEAKVRRKLASYFC